ncbi:anti-sigma factor domain-containing protein [Acidaminobacter sp. JC074]|uniref:anti-sigma factor domain-containing protein n=1 Tax=Acidaminobacter sp. JC074 TaxID=2530199 RepID=UPI001F0EBC7C|nr:anti-sigma factor domain-containing protein [Acidaminobacter sp. JC074]MCH4890054.1 anti-sigma factor domain-containing protein [Acidaminobacter sp. JC074]
MKHGLVTKIEKKFMIVKTESNDIERIKLRRDTKVGERVSFEKRDIYKGFGKFSYRQIGTSVSMLIMVVLIGGYLFNQASDNRVYGIVSYDVNPSMVIEVNKDYETLTVTGDPSLIPENYTDLPIQAVLDQMTEKALTLDILNDQDTIIISYDKDDIPLDDYLSKNKSNYKIVLVYHETETKASYGRQFIKEKLEEKDIIIKEDEDFINNALKALEDDFMEVEGIYKPQTKVQDDSSDSVENTETNEEDVTDTKDDQVEKPDDPIETEDDESNQETSDQTPDTVESDEKDQISQEELDALIKQIDDQKLKVDATYNNFINTKNAAENKQVEMSKKETEIAESKVNLEKKQAGSSELKDEYIVLSNEKVALEKALEGKTTEINEANALYNKKVENTKNDQEKVDKLYSTYEEEYDQARDTYLNDRITVIEMIEQEIINKDALIQEAGDNTDLANTYKEEKSSLEGMLETVYMENDYLSEGAPAGTYNYEFIYHYNSIYQVFEGKKAEINAIKDEADELQDDIDSDLKKAKKNLNTTLGELEEKYAEPEAVLASTNESIADFERIINNFSIAIDNLKNELAGLEAAYKILQDDYNALINKQSQYENQLYKERNLLKELEQKYDESTDSE